MKYNSTNQHFHEGKPDKIYESGSRSPVPPPHKEHVSPHMWGEIKPSTECTYENIIAPFRTMPRNYRIFLDTGFMTSHEVPKDLWEAILQKRVFITKGVRSELQPWLDAPRCNRWFSEYLKSAFEAEESGTGHEVVSIATIDDFSGCTRAVADYYVRLLWLRKYFAIHQFELFQEKHGRDPDIDTELQPICQKIAGARGWRIASKVLRDRRKPSVLVPVDEGIVVNALFHSTLYGEPTILLTRDNDVFEQWCKCIYLIDTHYQAMLLAEKYATAQAQFEKADAPDCAALYQGEGNTLLSPRFDYRELRDWNVAPIQATCGLLSTSDKPLMCSERTFGLVEDLARLVNVKGKTRGQNTDLFGEMNFHAQLDPRHVAFAEGGPALVNDVTMSTNNADDFAISINDAELAIFTNEQFSQEIFQYMEE